MSQIVTVESQDNLYTIAERVYGDETAWREVGEALKKSVFDPLISGEKIELPTKNELLNLAKKSAILIAQNELKKLYPELDLSVLKDIPGSDNPDTLIEWIL